MGIPVAYIRKSRVTTDRHVSWELQESKVRELAATRGDAENLLILSDWNKSGTKGASGRPGYRRLVEMIADGEVSAVYAYSLSRLGRSVPELRRVTDLCIQQGVPVAFADGEPRDITSTWGKFVLNILGSVAEMEADIAAERSLDTIAFRRARGDRIGPALYGEREGEDVAGVVAAFREAGSVLGAAKILNRDGKVPTRFGRPWSTTSVREILVRAEVMPAGPGRPGVKAAAPFILYRLLTCHCGATMTGSRYRNGSDLEYTTYRCIRGRADITHSRQSISERRLLPWVMAEAARLEMPADAVRIAEASHAERVEIIDERRRLALVFTKTKALDERTYQAEDGVLARRLADIEERIGAVETIAQAIDWSAPARVVNEALRSMWRHVELDADLLPVRAEWFNKSWRRD